MPLTSQEIYQQQMRRKKMAMHIYSSCAYEFSSNIVDTPVAPPTPPLEVTAVFNSSYGASNIFFDVLRVPIKNNGSVNLQIPGNTIDTYLTGGPSQGNILLRNSGSLIVAPGQTDYLLLNVAYTSAGGAPIPTTTFNTVLSYNITANFTGGATNNQTGTLLSNWTITGTDGATKSLSPSPATYTTTIAFTN